MAKRNLADPQFQKIIEQLENGEELKGKRAVRIYKHPIKKRTIVKSAGQRAAIRRK